MNENILIALVEELKKLNENLKEHNEIIIQHQSFEEVMFFGAEEGDLDS